MISLDPLSCRRALGESSEIAAMGVLPGGQTTDGEALQTIATIAQWVRAGAPGERAASVT